MSILPEKPLTGAGFSKMRLIYTSQRLCCRRRRRLTGCRCASTGAAAVTFQEEIHVIEQ